MTLRTRLYLLRHKIAAKLRLHFNPPRYFVATYGDMGLEVEFYRDPAEYDEACEEAERQHDDHNLDTYITGDVE